jgi:sulfatase maturation enzyme AslB (radical SAM superfamily)
MNQYSPDLLGMGAIERVMLDLTTRCNLRCVYCAVSLPNYRGIDMEADVVDKALSAIAELARHQTVKVCINGHGETTMLPHWVDVCDRLLQYDVELEIITNLSKSYSPRELAALAKIRHVIVSIDTVDRELLRKIRRHVDADRIVANISRIRSVAIAGGLPAPFFHFSTGLFDASVANLRELAAMAIALGIGSIQFWDLLEYERDAQAPETFVVRGLTTIGEPELTPLLAALDSALELLRQNGVFSVIAGGAIPDLLERYRSAVREPDTPEPPHTAVETEPPEEQHAVMNTEDPAEATRDCTDPWTVVAVRGDGGIAPCCRRPPIGTLAEDSLPNILNGAKARELKASLLSGRLDEYCSSCTVKAMTSPAELTQKVGALVANRSGAG